VIVGTVVKGVLSRDAPILLVPIMGPAKTQRLHPVS
jgi:hypothetical protein